MNVVLSVGARRELREATRWYAARSVRAARRFRAEYARALQRAMTAPAQWIAVEPGVHRVLFHRFPFALLYSAEADRLIVLAVAHQRRHPDWWRGE